ncbi:MAG: hypothetical protein LBH85_09450 [Treponema sp.]|nr:hypothetical protein [Treponema sp.]
MGESWGLDGFPLVDDVAVNERRAVVAAEPGNFEGAGETGGFKSFRRPDMGFVQQDAEPQPAGADAGNSKGEVEMARTARFRLYPARRTYLSRMKLFSFLPPP